MFKNILQQDIPLKISFNPEESLVPLTQSITSLDPFKHVNDCDWNENKISEESKSYLIFIYSTNIDSLEHDTVKFIRNVQIHFNVSHINYQMRQPFINWKHSGHYINVNKVFDWRKVRGLVE